MKEIYKVSGICDDVYFLKKTEVIRYLKEVYKIKKGLSKLNKKFSYKDVGDERSSAHISVEFLLDGQRW